MTTYTNIREIPEKDRAFASACIRFFDSLAQAEKPAWPGPAPERKPTPAPRITEHTAACIGCLRSFKRPKTSNGAPRKLCDDCVFVRSKT